MKALILVALVALSTRLSTSQELRLPDREVTLTTPCSDANVVLARAHTLGLSVRISMQVPAGTIVVVADNNAAAVILIHEGLACLLGAGTVTPPAPAAKPQRFNYSI